MQAHTERKKKINGDKLRCENVKNQIYHLNIDRDPSDLGKPSLKS